MNEITFSLPDANTIFSVRDVETTLEYLNSLKMKDLFSLSNQAASPTPQPNWIGTTYYSSTDKEYQFSDRNFQEAVSSVVDAWKKTLKVLNTSFRPHMVLCTSC